MPCGSDSYDCPHCGQEDVQNYEPVLVECPGPDACRMYHSHSEIVHTDCPSDMVTITFPSGAAFYVERSTLQWADPEVPGD